MTFWGSSDIVILSEVNNGGLLCIRDGLDITLAGVAKIFNKGV